LSINIRPKDVSDGAYGFNRKNEANTIHSIFHETHFNHSFFVLGGRGEVSVLGAKPLTKEVSRESRPTVAAIILLYERVFEGNESQGFNRYGGILGQTIGK